MDKVQGWALRTTQGNSRGLLALDAADVRRNQKTGLGRSKTLSVVPEQNRCWFLLIEHDLTPEKYLLTENVTENTTNNPFNTE